MSSRVAVIGVGNPLMGDDGLGLAALERLGIGWHVPPHVELIDGGTSAMQLLPIIESADEVVFLDAIAAGFSPGQLVVLERDQLPALFQLPMSPHHIGIQDTLALLELRESAPARMVALGLEPARVEWGVGLSREVEDGLPQLLRAVAARIGATARDSNREAACTS